MADTSIEWTQRPGTIGAVWNPTTGCDKISAGCDNCYALKMAKRLKAMGQAKYQNDGHAVTSGPGFALTVHADALTIPLKWRDPRTVFVNSMSDLFHARVPAHFVARVFAVMAATPQHTYQILTKRPERMLRLVGEEIDGGVALMEAAEAAGFASVSTALYEAPWPLPNVWLGASIESDDRTGRAAVLRKTSAAVRFISAEPLLGPLPSLDLTAIDWLILGGESGPGARPLNVGWFHDLVDKAQDSGPAVFVKQLGSVWAQDTHVAGQPVARTDPKGGRLEYLPKALRIREYPTSRVEAVA